MLRLMACAALALGIGTTPAMGQTVEAVQAEQADHATLTVYNHPIVTFRAPLGARSPAERASGAATRLTQVLEERHGGVTARAAPEGAVIRVGDQPVFTITPADVDTFAGEDFQSVVNRSVERTRIALDAGAEQRNLTAIVRGVLISIAATAVFLVLLRLLRIARRVILHRLLRASRARLQSLSVGGYKLVDTDRVLGFARRAVELVTWAAGLALAYLWLTLVLTQFAYSRPWGNALGHYLVVTLSGLVTSVLQGIPGLFTIVLIFVMTRFIVRLMNTVFDAVQSDSLRLAWLHPDTVTPTRRIVAALLWLFAVAIAYPHLPGSDTDIFKGVSIFAGLIITLGSSGVVGQAMSGLVLMYSRSLKIGEYVQLANTEGTVVDLGMLATKIRTPKGELVTLPNAVVVTTSAKNYSRYRDSGELVVYTSVTIGYDTPWRQVHEMLSDAAQRTRGVKADPAPFVMQTALSDFYVEYQVNVYTDQPEQRMSILAALHENIQDCFHEQGVQIMSPHFRAQPAEPVLVPKGRWYGPFAAQP